MEVSLVTNYIGHGHVAASALARRSNHFLYFDEKDNAIESFKAIKFD